MKCVMRAGLVALAVAMTMGGANAADMPRRQAMPAKAPVYAAPYSWTGFYAGISGGYGWGTSEWSNSAGTTGSFDINGGLVGGTLGYNWQMGQAVFGVEGDISWSGISGSTLGVETKNNWLGTARGRIGYAFDRVMPYITGGLAVGDIEANAGAFGSETVTNAGWTLGGGAEFAVAGPWTAKIEYLYVDLGNGWCGPAVCGLGTDVKFQTNIVRGGINYRF